MRESKKCARLKELWRSGDLEVVLEVGQLGCFDFVQSSRGLMACALKGLTSVIRSTTTIGNHVTRFLQ